MTRKLLAWALPLASIALPLVIPSTLAVTTTPAPLAADSSPAAPAVDSKPADPQPGDPKSTDSKPADLAEAPASKAAAQALKLLLDGHEGKAQDVLLGAYRQGNQSGTGVADVSYFLAAFDKQHEKPDSAVKYLSQARDLYGRTKSLSDRQQMLLTKRIGDCYYSGDKLKDSLREYNVALIASKKLPDGGMSTAEILEGMVACEMGLKQFAEAEKHSAELVELSQSRLPAGGMNEVASYSWALLQEADLFRTTNQKDKLDALRKNIRTLFISLIESRMLAQAQGQFPDYHTLVQEVRREYVEAIKPVSPPEIAWAASDFRVRTLPVIAWKNQTPNAVAAILCIHGLGLENRAFTSMAAELNRRGYLVYALDVRGFGSWTQTRGEEVLNYPQTLADIRNVSEVIKQRNPGLPLYVLGESMGGAIALRAGAQLGDVLNGVISSVPSAERFQEKKMSLQTAMHFIIDPHKAFDIGSTVAERATSQESLRTQWKEDPKAKMGMTPIELMKFALFMRTTKPQAARITKLPVLMLQGLQDQLVKPQGTFDLFDAVKSTDKTFLTIGKAEHLMFENNSPDPFLMDALDSWLRNHSQAASSK